MGTKPKIDNDDMQLVQASINSILLPQTAGNIQVHEN